LFGAHIAHSGGLLTVASIGSDALPVQVYRRVGNNWLPETSLLPTDISAQSYCVSAAVHTGRIAVGCSNHPGPSGPGATYLFEKIGNTWAQTQTLTHANARQGDGFGSVVHFHDDGTLFVSAPIRATDFFGQGAVYRYVEPALLSNGFE
jgi:hypothetical protein